MLNSKSIKQPKENFLSITPRHLYIFFVFLFLSLIFMYAAVKFIPFLFFPEIIIAEPAAESAIVNSAEILMEGETKNANSLTLNGRELYIGKNGKFGEIVSLREGINTISLEAKNIFGRKAEIIRSVVYIEN